MKDQTIQDQAAAVPAGVKQAAEAHEPEGTMRSRWAWTEASVWTDRMLKALEDGVKGGVWFSLIRWPNAYFAAQGLFSLTQAHALACQSAKAANH